MGHIAVDVLVDSLVSIGVSDATSFGSRSRPFAGTSPVEHRRSRGVSSRISRFPLGGRVDCPLFRVSDVRACGVLKLGRYRPWCGRVVLGATPMTVAAIPSTPAALPSVRVSRTASQGRKECPKVRPMPSIAECAGPPVGSPVHGFASWFAVPWKDSANPSTLDLFLK